MHLQGSGERGGVDGAVAHLIEALKSAVDDSLEIRECARAQGPWSYTCISKAE